MHISNNHKSNSFIVLSSLSLQHCTAPCLIYNLVLRIHLRCSHTIHTISFSFLRLYLGRCLMKCLLCYSIVLRNVSTIFLQCNTIRQRSVSILLLLPCTHQSIRTYVLRSSRCYVRGLLITLRNWLTLRSRNVHALLTQVAYPRSSYNTAHIRTQRLYRHLHVL